MDVLRGDSEEQDRGERRQHQRDGDDRLMEATSHQVKVRGGKSVLWLPVARMLSQPACGSRFTCCLPPVLRFTDFMFLLHVPETFLTAQWKQLQGYCCHEGKNVLYHGQTCCRNCCSFSFLLHLSLWKEDKDDSQLLSYQWEGVACMLAEVQRVDCWAEQLQSCVFIQEADLHVNSCSWNPDLQMLSSPTKSG